jgi:large subunit ribosomal protein L33
MPRKTGEVRGIITLQCGDCRERNYATMKNRRNDTQRLEIKKYCSRCRGHKVHREVR